MKGTPKKDGSGRGTGANAGRGGCTNPKSNLISFYEKHSN